MNLLKTLILVVGSVASVTVFLLMRYPALRREQFQQGRAFSVTTSALGALALLAVFSLIAARGSGLAVTHREGDVRLSGNVGGRPVDPRAHSLGGGVPDEVQRSSSVSASARNACSSRDRSLTTTSQTASQSMLKYACTSAFRMPTICPQGMSGANMRVSWVIPEKAGEKAGTKSRDRTKSRTKSRDTDKKPGQTTLFSNSAKLS